MPTLPKRGSLTPAVGETLRIYVRLLAPRHRPGQVGALTRRLNTRLAALTPRELAAYYAGAYDARLRAREVTDVED